MSTLILPCAGRSSRFPNLPPKWMLQNDTKESMIEMVIDSMPQSFDQTIVTITAEQQDKWRAFDFLNSQLKWGGDVNVLENQTNSASETVYQTIKDCSIEGSIVIKDCDCSVEYQPLDFENYIVGLNIKKDTEVKRLESKSFIKKNDDNIIEDIIEKRMVSNNICVGVYSCNAAQYCTAYEEVTTSDVYLHGQEVYVSHIFSYMALTGAAVFSYIEADEFVDWGTIEDWENNKNG
jgi:bifunctional N-acetylglucosamine-1-phosphate-uridyltransferase/glucosamine-1-phosphate-acetyltransferase GlmU-like protein